MTMGYLRAVSDVPNGEHWAILTFGSFYIPGDERSRQAPGHGYPARTESTMTYEWFGEQAKFDAELARRFSSTQAHHTTVGIHVLDTYGPSVTVAVRKREDRRRED